MPVNPIKARVHAGMWWGLDPDDEDQLARLTEAQILIVPGLGRRSVEKLAAWLARDRDDGGRFRRRRRLGTGEPVEKPPGRRYSDRPWEARKGAGPPLARPPG